MAKIFISYRRIDSQHITDRIYDKLINSFGYANIFKDVDSIAIGKNFMDEIKVSLEKTDIFLLIIGKNWVGQEADGSLRINNLDDFVRVELENAIKLELPIIPILVNDASMPSNLPTSIKKITKINALKVRADPDFNNDIMRLLEILPKKNKNYYFKFLGASLMILTMYLSLPYIKQNTTDIFPVEPQVKPIVDDNTDIVKRNPKLSNEQLLINGCKVNKSNDCYNLAIKYRDGIEVKKSLKKAATYFEKSCELNDKSACTHIGYMYENAIGVVKNTIKAIKLYKKACKLGEGQGCSYLGWKYTYGVPKDLSLAKEYYDKACHLGYQPACDMIKKKEKLLYSLTIQPTPSDARIEIMNIKPKYKEGMKLTKDKYQIRVSKKGYVTKNIRVNLIENVKKKIVLQEKATEVIPITKTKFSFIHKGKEEIINLNNQGFIVISVREQGSDGRFYAVDKNKVWLSGAISTGVGGIYVKKKITSTTPTGIWKITSKKIYNTSVEWPNADGSNNMNYSLMFGNKGIAIHEGDTEWMTPDGCVQVESNNMKKLFKWAKEGMSIIVTRHTYMPHAVNDLR